MIFSISLYVIFTLFANGLAGTFVLITYVYCYCKHECIISPQSLSVNQDYCLT